jgi:WD40 repeat protein
MVAVIMLVLIGLTSWANYEAWYANTQFRDATARKLVAQAQGMLAGNLAGGDVRAYPQLAAASRLGRDNEVDSALLQALVTAEDKHWIAQTRYVIVAVAFSPDGTLIVSGSEDKTLRLWDVKTGQTIGQPMQGHENGVTSVAFSPDGSRIVSGSYDQTLRLWDARTGQPIGPPIRGHEDSVTSVAFSPDGGRLASGGQDSVMRLWDAKTGRSIGQPLKGHDGPVLSIAFSPDGTRLVSGSDDNTLRLWDVKTGLPIGQPLKGHEERVTSVAFSSNGRLLVSGDWDTLRLWNANTGAPVGPSLDDSGIMSAVFSPDDAYIVSGRWNWDEPLQLWDARTGAPIGRPLKGHKGPVTSVAFNRDGTRFVSSSHDKTLRLWPSPQIWTEELCKKLTRNMSHREWREWVSPDIDYIEQCPGLPIPPDQPEGSPFRV